MLVIFYDGQCPLCATEMAHLKQRDTAQKLQLEDIHQSDFERLFPDINRVEAMKILHGKLDGKLLLGLDVTYHAWCLVGLKIWVLPLRWPLVGTIAAVCYRFFARHRQRFSKVLMPHKTCFQGVCLSKRSTIADTAVGSQNTTQHKR